jgi:RNA polymerase sigma-70 factor (ECF subfamily)
MDITRTDQLDDMGPLLCHREAIYQYLRRLVKDAVEAEDLTQEVFLRACSKLSTLKDRTKVLSWLYRIATNVCHDRFRQPSQRVRLDSLDATGEGGRANRATPPLEPGFAGVVEQKEMSACVQEHLDVLPEPYRTVIRLHDVEGLTNPEIVERLGLTLATVKIRLHRARQKLRASLNGGCAFSRDERDIFVCERKPRG